MLYMTMNRLKNIFILFSGFIRGIQFSFYSKTNNVYFAKKLYFFTFFCSFIILDKSFIDFYAFKFIIFDFPNTVLVFIKSRMRKYMVVMNMTYSLKFLI